MLSLRNWFILIVCVVSAAIIVYNASFRYQNLGLWKTFILVTPKSIQGKLHDIKITTSSTKITNSHIVPVSSTRVRHSLRRDSSTKNRSTRKEGKYEQEWTSPTIHDSQELCASIIQDRASPLPSSVGCRIPFMDAFHPQIMKFILPTKDPKCPGKRYGELKDGVFNFLDPRVKSATYKAIKRRGDTGYVMSGNRPIAAGQKITYEYIEVDYVLDNNQHAKELFLHAVPKARLLKRESKTQPGIPIDVLVIGIDSVSHASAQRKLPLVYKYLRDDLGAYFFHGHSVTGDGTVEQMAPMLTGRKFFEELYEARPDKSKSRPVDGWPWIYKQLIEHGYITGYNEDGTHLGPFNWRLLGFSAPPTDYYPIHFFRRTKALMKGVDQCVGAKNVNQYQYDFIKSFFKVFANKLKFFVSFTAGYSHHELNRVQKLQRDLLILLQDLKSKNVLNNTLLIIMGDHGVRWGKVRETIQGKLEERMPFFSMAFPPWFASKFPNISYNLRRNGNRLTTWYDVYATLRHMLSYPDLPRGIKHGQSLFTDIPKSRTCKDAFVPGFWCPCLRWSAVGTKHTHVQKLAITALEWMNLVIANSTETASQCATLSLKNVTHALLERPNDLVLRFQHVDLSYTPRFRPHNNPPQSHYCRYQVRFITEPNNAAYVVEGKFYKEQFTINTNITRIEDSSAFVNRQAQCAKEHQLTKYFACKTNS